MKFSGEGSRDDPESPHEQVNRLLNLIGRVLKAFGGDARAYYQLVVPTDGDPTVPLSLPRTAGVEIPVDVFPRVLTRWHVDPLFVDDVGRPQPLEVFGTVSVSRLAEREGLSFDARALYDALLAYGFAVESRPGLIRVTTRAVQGAQEFTMRYGLRVATHALQTFLHNLETEEKSSNRLFQRAAWGALPLDQEQEFRAFVHRQGMSFLSSIDDWLARVASQRDHGVPTRTADVHLFLTLGPRSEPPAG